jgi:hypothetical protein
VYMDWALVSFLQLVSRKSDYFSGSLCSRSSLSSHSFPFFPFLTRVAAEFQAIQLQRSSALTPPCGFLFFLFLLQMCFCHNGVTKFLAYLLFVLSYRHLAGKIDIKYTVVKNSMVYL